MKSKFELTADQLEGKRLLHKAALEETIFLLRGSAGVGKTHIVSEFVDEFHGKIIVTAPTHKAVKVLQQKVNAECKTIHAYLRMKVKIVRGKQKFIFNKNEKIEKCDVLVIDEASMIDSVLLEHILDSQVKIGFKIIFLGDEKQLNPVDEVDSPVFNRKFPDYELTTIVRHDNDIIDLSRNLNWLSQRRTGEHFKWLDPTDMDLDLLVQANGTDDCKFITWTNKTVRLVNNAVRNHIYGAEVEQIEVGETLLMTNQFKSYKNNQEVKVREVQHSIRYFEGAKHKEINTLTVNGDLIIVSLESQKKHEENLTYMADLCLNNKMTWKVFYSYKESFADYQYNHAITVHKSQGSTYRNCILNISEMQRNRNPKERRRLLYTAITRASDTNYMI